MKILGTGLTGLVGSRIVELLKGAYEFDFSSVDITNKYEVNQKIKSSDASIVLHLAAKADVEGCEKDKEEDNRILQYSDSTRQEKEWVSKKTAWAVNVFGTKNITDACTANNKKLIYISTDFVFDGTKREGYTEEDVPNPLNWYAKTKYEGEKIVQNSSLSWIIARIAYPYRANFIRNDFARAILSRLKKGERVSGVIDHIFTPTFIDDISLALDVLIKQDSMGIYHVVGSQSLTPFNAAIAIANVFDCDESLVSQTTREVFFKDRAPRPFFLEINNAKIEKLGIKMKTLEEGLMEVKKQL